MFVDDLDCLPGVKVHGKLAVSLGTLLKAIMEVVGLAAAHFAHPVGAVVPELPVNR